MNSLQSRRVDLPFGGGRGEIERMSPQELREALGVGERVSMGKDMGVMMNIGIGDEGC